MNDTLRAIVVAIANAAVVVGLLSAKGATPDQLAMAGGALFVGSAGGLVAAPYLKPILADRFGGVR